MNEVYAKMIETLQEEIKPLEEQIRPITVQIDAKKKLINQLCNSAGAQPLYPEVETERPVSVGLGAILPDQYFGKPTATVVRDILERRKRAGLSAIPLTDLYDAMKAGGFEFESKDPVEARRAVAITLGKNTQTFKQVPSTGSWGLAEWYPNAAKKTKQPPPPPPASSATEAPEAKNESPATPAEEP